MRVLLSTAAASAIAAAGLAFAAPAFAQTIDELIITGRLGPNVTSLSERVSYADLDLTIPDHQETLKLRVRDTADRLCTLLGERDSGASGLLPTCKQDAVRDAMKQVRFAIANAQPRYGAPYAGAAAAEVSTIAPIVDNVRPAEPTYTMTTVTNGPVADTAANRARFGGPMSNAGRRTAPVGN